MGSILHIMKEQTIDSIILGIREISNGREIF